MPELMISFDDSQSDPTYSPASECWLVEVEVQGDENPCTNEYVKQNKGVVAPLIPLTESELRNFAKVFGWQVAIKDGQMVMVTDIPQESVDPNLQSKMVRMFW